MYASRLFLCHLVLLNHISGCFLFAFGACLSTLLGAISKVSGWYVALGQLPPGVNTGCLVMFLMFLFARGLASPRWRRCVCLAESIKLVPCDQQSISTVINTVCLAESISMVGSVGRHHLPPGVNARVRARAGLGGGRHPKTTGNRFHAQVIHRHTH